MLLELDGRKAEPSGAIASTAPSSVVAQDSERARLANLERLQHLIDRAGTGTLVRDRDLKPWEPDRLSPVHIQMCLDRAAGASVTEVAAKYDYDISRVSVVLRHPDAQQIMTTVLSMSADRLVDVTERLKYLAPEALNVKVELMRLAGAESLRDKAASDILSMAGFGSRKGIEVNVNDNRRQTLVLPAQAAEGLMAALAEARRVEGTDYTQHLANAAGGENSAEHKQLSGGLMAGAGYSVPEGGASPIQLPEAPAEPDFEIEGWSAIARDAARMQAALDDEADSTKERVA